MQLQHELGRVNEGFCSPAHVRTHRDMCVPCVQGRMGLRHEQEVQLLQLRRQLLETMSTLLQERRMIQALIKAILQLSPPL